MRRLLPFIVLLNVTISSFAQTFKPLEQAQGFNVFVQNNLTARGGDTHGPVAMGADLVLNGNTIFTMNTSGKYPTGNLNDYENYGMVIGGQVQFVSGNQTQVNQGFLRLGNETGSKLWYKDNNNANTNLKITAAGADFSSNPSVILQRQQAEGTASLTSALNFTAAFSTFTSAANKINSWTASNNALLNKITIPAEQNPHIALADNRINYINLTAAQLSDLNNQGSIIFDNAPTISRPVVFNIQAAGTYSWSVPNFGGLSESDGDFIIWNFYNTTVLNLNGSNNIYGSILSPLANITKNNPNNLNGQVIGKSLDIVSGEIHYHPFVTNRPDPPQESPLGVREIALTGSFKQHTASLSWTVLEEVDIAGYTIERSSDAINFTSIGSIGSRGNSSRSVYSFSDAPAVVSKTIYYRVRANELSGREYLSKVIAIRTDNAGTTLETWPNPVAGQLNVKYVSSIDQTVVVTVVDMPGKVVKRSSYSFSKGINQVAMDGFESLKSGVYTLYITDGNNQQLGVRQLLK